MKTPQQSHSGPFSDRTRKLKELLAKETYPHTFPFKFIGKNSPAFLEGVRNFQNNHPKLRLHSKKDSKNQNHLSYTFLLEAHSEEPILEAFEEIEKIPDILVIL